MKLYPHSNPSPKALKPLFKEQLALLESGQRLLILGWELLLFDETKTFAANRMAVSCFPSKLMDSFTSTITAELLQGYLNRNDCFVVDYTPKSYDELAIYIDWMLGTKGLGPKGSKEERMTFRYQNDQWNFQAYCEVADGVVKANQGVIKFDHSEAIVGLYVS